MKYRILSFLAFFSALAGCNLESPPECVMNQEKCVDSGFGPGLYYVCGSNGRWNFPMACSSECEDNVCAGFVNTRLCDIEGDHLCLDDEAINVSLYCHNNHWIMTPCMGECVNNECIGGDTGCEEDDMACVFVESLNLSFEMECIDKQWVSRPCTNGVSCDGEQCVQSPNIKCTEPDGQPCKGKDTWSMARCNNGQCIPEKCKDTYILSNGDCYNQSECCGNDCVNCNALGLICNADQVCDNPDNCTSPNAVCHGVCINTTTSHDFCGADQNCEHYQACAAEMSCGYDEGMAAYSCICDGKSNCNNVCYDLASTLEHCGTCETDCTQLAGWKSGECIQGKCQASECAEPFLLTTVTVDGNEVKTCVSEIKVECGEDKVDCAGTIEGWASGHCDTVDVYGEQQEICVIDTCQEGYHIYDNTCEPDGADHCGNHETTCTTSDIPGSDEVLCKAGICTLISCDSAYIQNGDSCLPRDCQEEQTQCVNEFGTFIGKIQKCTGNQWIDDSVCTGDVSCKDTDGCGDCRNGQKRCMDHNIEVCRTGEWSLDTECRPTIEGATATCDTETGCGNACPADKATVCAGVCVDTKTNTLHCGGCNTSCQTENATNECHNSTCSYTCDSGFTDNGKKCCPNVNHGTITYNHSDDCQFTCDSNYIASGDGCIERNCTEGNTKCVNDNNVGEMQKCVDNAWKKTSTCANSYSCNAAETACSTVCQNMTKKCTVNGNDKADSIQNCNKGDWGSAKECTTKAANAIGACKSETACGGFKCPSGYTSTGTACVSNDVYCEKNNAERCVTKSGSAGKMQKCIDHVWTDQNDCSNGYSCNAARTACGECANNDKKCTDSSNIGTVYTCTNGSWGTGTSCESVSCNGTACGECKNTTKSCTNSGNIGKVKTCSKGAWGTASTCTNSYSCNSDGTDCGSCQNTTKSCTNSGNVGKVKTCSKGAWGSASTCTNSYSCKSDGTGCGSCQNTTYSCTTVSNNNDTVRYCSSGSLGNSTTCSTSVSDAWGACSSPDSNCGTYKCKSGYTDSGSECISNDIYCATNGATRCVKYSGETGAMQTCSSHKWTLMYPCSYSCNSAGTSCGSCLNGDKKCENTDNIGKTYTCVNGAWNKTSDCSNVSCNGTVCGECKNGTTSCSNSGTTGQLTTCSNGKKSTSACSSDYSCNSAGTGCGSCVNGATRCSNSSVSDGSYYKLVGYLSTCANGSFQYPSQCPSGTSCYGTTACLPAGSCNYSTRYSNKTTDYVAEWCSNATTSPPVTTRKLRCPTPLTDQGCKCDTNNKGFASVTPEGFSPYFQCINGYLTGYRLDAY